MGISPGQPVRFRRRDGGRWRTGTAVGVERDASITIREDATGAIRAITVDRIEVRVGGRRGSLRWDPLADVAARTEQLRLL